MTEATNQQTYKKNSTILATELEDEAVLLSIEKQCYFGLPATSRRIWELLEQPQSLDSLCSSLQQEYEVDGDTCRRDVAAFLENLSKESLVQVVAAQVLAV
jgi:hypothetical protein